MMVNLLLVVGAVKRIPHHTFPWLCSNAVIIAILMVSCSAVTKEIT